MMNRIPGKIAAGLGAAMIALGISTAASAQTYPSQRITFIVGFAAGGFTDVVARIVGEHVSKKLGQPVVVENRGGAASNIAARAVTGAKPDGYTVLVSTTALAINATLHKKIDYSLIDDLIPVAIAVRAPETFGAKPGGAKTLKEFLEQAKANNSNFGSAGAGTGSHLTWFGFFKTNAKVNVVHVPFQGAAPAQQAVTGGQVDGLAATASGAVVTQLSEGGKLNCLAVAAAQRYHLLPNCPTLGEVGFPGVEGSSWVGFWVPKGTPASVVAALNGAINSITEDAKATESLKKNGDLTGFTVQQADAFVKSEVASWGERVKAAGAQVE
jgi:tripartite-type tricarboxylate transporter receptor subunit TctC